MSRWNSAGPLGQFQRAGELAAELVRLKVDVIYVDNASIRAVQRATTTIPIVMFAIDDPVAEGCIASLARPGGNIAGVDAETSTMGLGGKLLELLAGGRTSELSCGYVLEPGYPRRGRHVARGEERSPGLGHHACSAWRRESLMNSRVPSTLLEPEDGGPPYPAERRLHPAPKATRGAGGASPAAGRLHSQPPFAQEGGLLAYRPMGPTFLPCTGVPPLTSTAS